MLREVLSAIFPPSHNAREAYPSTFWIIYKLLLLASVNKGSAKNIDFFIWVFFHESKGRGKAISSTPLYHFHLFLRHVDISGEATADSSPQKPSLFNHKLLITNLCRKQSLVSTKTWNFETWEIVTKCFFIPPNLHWKSKFLPAKVS